MSEKRPNVHPLFLPTEMYLAVADVQSKMRIGKSAAILWLINEGMRKHGFIDETTYVVLRDRYSKPLLDIVRKNKESKDLVRCGWAGCRHMAIAMVKYRDRDVLPTCIEHLEKAKGNPNFEVLKESVKKE